MTPEIPITGLVLAGGASRRMGTDKALLRLGDRSLVEHQVAQLAPWCERVVVASGDGRRLPGSWEQVADVDIGTTHDGEPDAPGGPLHGLVAGLRAAHTPWVAVLAVDLVAAAPTLLRWLVSTSDGNHLSAIPHADGHPQVLHAVYRPEAADALVAEASRLGTASLRACTSGPSHRHVPEDEWATVVPPGWARNVNDPEDARAAGVVRPQSSASS